ncbi:MAG: hypothetical protein HY020_17670 [Burkholderiales bacterium]|nr:hypothetical protein [Burkholderiales bacterium]
MQYRGLRGNRLLTRFITLALFGALAACGGGGSDRYQEAIDAANKKEAEARAAGVTSPCATVSQCGVLTFQSPMPSCSNWSYKPYSIASPSAAAASAAAAEQNVLARQALALAPASGTVCPAVVPPVPVLTCVANTCGGA